LTNTAIKTGKTPKGDQSITFSEAEEQSAKKVDELEELLLAKVNELDEAL
jgi:hypothetical protein